MEEHTSYSNVKPFQGGLVFEAHRLFYHSTLGLRLIKKEEERVSVKQLVDSASVKANHGRVGRVVFKQKSHGTGEPPGGIQPCYPKSTYLTQLTLGPHVVPTWSRNPWIPEAPNPSNSTVWFWHLAKDVIGRIREGFRFRVDVFVPHTSSVNLGRVRVFN